MHCFGYAPDKDLISPMAPTTDVLSDHLSDTRLTTIYVERAAGSRHGPANERFATARDMRMPTNRLRPKNTRRKQCAGNRIHPVDTCAAGNTFTDRN